jgi:hypothetical protein
MSLDRVGFSFVGFMDTDIFGMMMIGSKTGEAKFLLLEEWQLASKRSIWPKCDEKV